MLYPVAPGNDRTDVILVGAGIIGLSLALELYARGHRLTVLESRQPMHGASSAAAGMLAADDPHNPAALQALSQYSLSLYPSFLAGLASAAGVAVPFQTESTVQYRSFGSPQRLAERSIDPRQLADALLRAVELSSIRMVRGDFVCSEETTTDICAHLAGGSHLCGTALVHAGGAYATKLPAVPGPAVSLAPRKGQMLRVRTPAGAALTEVHRSEHVYIVPRRFGPQAGTTLIGATVEDVGFDASVQPEALIHLRALAAELVPALGSERDAPQVEAWAGFRPYTPDTLPLLGRVGRSRDFLAAGHFRNGILLAPATANVMADLIEAKQPAIDLAPFAVTRLRTT